MHYIYLLKSEKDNYIYIGNTNDLERRLVEHNSANNTATKKHRPFKLVYYEAYLDKRDALDRENKLKHHGSVIGHLKKRLKYSLSC
ncbi:MAG: GIY-YIG nuclease family protein [Candidatus Omnitrophota bacterium]